MDKENICMAGILMAALNTCPDEEFDYVLNKVGDTKLENVARRVVDIGEEVGDKELLDFMAKEFSRLADVL